MVLIDCFIPMSSIGNVAVIFELINSGQSNPSGDEGSMNPLHISTTTRAGKFPIPVGYD